MACAGFVETMTTNRSGSATGGFLSSQPLTTLKIVLFTAMPSASVAVVTKVNPGFFASMRIP